MAAKFTIFKGSNGEFYFNLKAGNGERILRSEGYISKQGCENGIKSVKEHAPYDKNYDRKKSVNNQYYFNLKASNGEIIGTSETYTTEAGRDNGIESVKSNAPSAQIDDLTE